MQITTSRDRRTPLNHDFFLMLKTFLEASQPHLLIPYGPVRHSMNISKTNHLTRKKKAKATVPEVSGGVGHGFNVQLEYRTSSLECKS